MDDLISRAAAIECAIDAVDDWKGGWNPNHETVIRKYFEELPAVDAMPVVRCSKCKYGKLYLDADGHSLIQCNNPNYPTANVETWPLELDWYCAGGERRDGDT